jgi:hypothetical protein
MQLSAILATASIRSPASCADQQHHQHAAHAAFLHNTHDIPNVSWFVFLVKQAHATLNFKHGLESSDGI